MRFRASYICCVIVLVVLVMGFESVFNVPVLNDLLEQGVMLLVAFIIVLCVCCGGSHY